MPRHERAHPARPDRSPVNPFTGAELSPIPGKPASVSFAEVDLDGLALVEWDGEVDAATGGDLYAPQRRRTRFQTIDQARAALERRVAALAEEGYRPAGAARGRGEPEPPLDPRAGGVDAFADGLDRVPWLVNLGADPAADADVICIRSFDAWLGPEDEGTALLNERLMGWKDALDAGAPDPAWPARADRIGASVHTRASWNVAFDPAEDPWYGPNAAVASAAFVSTLLAQHLAHRRPIPDELFEVWGWYARGHWPAAYDAEHDPPRLVVF